jgi:hypothetical protein
MDLEQAGAPQSQRADLKRRLDGYKGQLQKARRDLVHKYHTTIIAAFVINLFDD